MYDDIIYTDIIFESYRMDIAQIYSIVSQISACKCTDILCIKWIKELRKLAKILKYSRSSNRDSYTKLARMKTYINAIYRIAGLDIRRLLNKLLQIIPANIQPAKYVKLYK